MIQLEGVVKRYESADSAPYTAVDGVSLILPAQRLTLLTGPSGSGKTTLLTLLGCMARPTAGRIHLTREDGRLEVSSLPERFLAEIRRSTFGFIFQHFNLVRGLSTLDNVTLPARPTGRDPREVEARALELLTQFEVGRHARTRVERLSGGELQRVAIARALINDPAVLVADEPTAHLDTRLSREFMEIMGHFKAAGRTLVIASHDPLVTESGLADVRFDLRDGRLVGSSTP